MKLFFTFHCPHFKSERENIIYSQLLKISVHHIHRKFALTATMVLLPKMFPVVKSLFDSRTKSFFDSDITSLGVLPSIAEALHKYELFDHFENWYSSSTFPTNIRWKQLCRKRFPILRGMDGIPSANPILI